MLISIALIFVMLLNYIVPFSLANAEANSNVELTLNGELYQAIKNKLVALGITAEFNGAVYNVQVINKGSKLSLIEPTSTEYVIFNYWEDEEGNQVDLSTKTFNESTKLIANVTYKYDVNFYVDNASVDDQIIIKNGYATKPANPQKSGYEFDGWSLDGQTVVEVSETPITKNTGWPNFHLGAACIFFIRSLSQHKTCLTACENKILSDVIF